MKLRTKKSYFQNLPEGQAPKRFWPQVVKLFYFMLLIGIVAGVCYVVAMRFLYFKGDGLVETEKVILGSSKSGTIKAVYKSPGQSFKAGEILAEIELEKDCRIPEPDIRPTRLAHDIFRLEAEVNVFKSQLSTLKPIENPLILHRALEIGDTNTMIRQKEQIQKEQNRLREKIALLTVEIKGKKAELSALRKELAQPQTSVCQIEAIRAPFNGFIFHVTRKQDEYTGRGDPLVVAISEGADVSIEAYFNWNLTRYIVREKIMTVTFPDGTTSVGKIADFASAAANTVRQIQKNYMPVESKLWVRLVPTTDKDRLLWKKYDRMDISITGERQ